MTFPRCIATALFASLLASTGCLPGDEGADARTSTHTLEGAWSVRALESVNTCPEFGSMAPVDPGTISIVREAGAWLLGARGLAEPMRYAALADNRWSRSVSVPYEGCRIVAQATWDFDTVGETRFSSRYQADFRVVGDGCGEAVDVCHVQYAVDGARR